MDKIEPFGIFIVLGLVLVGLPIIGPVLGDLYTSISNLIIGV